MDTELDNSYDLDGDIYMFLKFQLYWILVGLIMTHLRRIRRKHNLLCIIQHKDSPINQLLISVQSQGGNQKPDSLMSINWKRLGLFVATKYSPRSSRIQGAILIYIFDIIDLICGVSSSQHLLDLAHAKYNELEISRRLIG